MRYAVRNIRYETFRHPSPVTKPSVTYCAECEALRAEAKHLKLELAKAHGGRPPAGDKAMTSAERMKKLRASEASCVFGCRRHPLR